MTQVGSLLRRHFSQLVLWTQVFVDALVIAGACALGYWLVLQFEDAEKMIPLDVYFQLWGLITVVCLTSFYSFGMYKPVKSLLNVEEFEAIAKSVVVSFFLVLSLVVLLRGSTQGVDAQGMKEEVTGIYSFLLPLHRWIDLDLDPNAFSRLTVVTTFFLLGTFTSISRFFSFRLFQLLHRRGIGNRNVLILGSGKTGRRLMRKFVLIPTMGLRMVGFVSEDPEEVGEVHGRAPVLGSIDKLREVIREHKVHEVFVALPECEEAHLMEIIAHLEEWGVSYRVVPRFYHLMSQRVKIENLDSIPLISRPHRHEGWPRTLAKRVMDIVLSLTIMLLGLPLFAIIAFLVKRESPGPIFYRQVRIGRYGRKFKMLKFRTMFTHMSGDAPAPNSAGDPRITRVGRYLRRTSLDELPQFLNVLSGEMSIVGPRPEMPFIAESYEAFDRERLRVKPGITGLWQISSDRQSEIHENLDYDIYYVENQSVLLDLVIIALTMFAVARGTGAH